MVISTPDAQRLETFDIAEHFDEVSPWQVRFDQLSKGQMVRRFEYVRMPGLMFHRDRWNQRIRVTGSSPPGYLQIGVAAPDNPGIVFQGEKLGSRRLSVVGPSREVEFTTAHVSHHDCVLVAPELLQRYLGEECVNSLLTTGHTLECKPQFSALLYDTIERLTTQVLAEGACSLESRSALAIESELLSVLAQGAEPNIEQFTRCAKQNRQRALRVAVEYAESLNQAIPIPELAQVAGVSQRTLQMVFHETFGVSPVTYLRWLRMNHLRRELQAADSNSTSVTAACSNWGFFELGRLAIEFRQLFGECPSIVLKKTVPVAYRPRRPS